MKAVSGLEWIHAVRDSKDILDQAEVPKYRRDYLADPKAAKYVAPSTVKLVAFGVGSYMNGDGVARVGYRTLAEHLGVAPKTAQLAVQALAGAGWVLVAPGGGAGKTNVYTAQIPAHAEFLKTGFPGPRFEKRGSGRQERSSRNHGREVKKTNPPGVKEVGTYARAREAVAAQTALPIVKPHRDIG